MRYRPTPRHTLTDQGICEKTRPVSVSLSEGPKAGGAVDQGKAPPRPISSEIAWADDPPSRPSPPKRQTSS